MNVDSLTRNLRVLWRANTIIAEIRLRHAAAQGGLFLFAGLVGAFGLVMLGIAGFFALQETYGTVHAALIVGGAGVVLAVILGAIGASLKPGRDLDLANEIHRSALEAVSYDIKSAEADVAMVRGLLRNPMESVLPALLVPALNFLMGRLRGGARKS